MSHFTVLVKVTADRLDRHGGDIDAAVSEMMAPYQENNMGDCPREFMEFQDAEPEGRQSWENDTVTRVKMPDGTLLEPYDDRFRVPGEIGIGSGTHKVPPHLEQVEVPVKELYPDWERYMEEYEGYRRDSETGKFGRWENPNRKWDYWRIGGRWRGKLRVKECAATAAVGPKAWELKADTLLRQQETPDQPHTADIATIEDIDIEGMELEIGVKIDEFWAKVERLKAYGLFDPNLDRDVKATIQKMVPEEDRWLDYEVHGELWDLGLRYRNSHTAPFTDKPFTLDDLRRDYRWHWAFQTFAVVDDEGWHEKGEMGWFACSSDSAEDRERWGREYMDRFIRNEASDTTLVVCDCHI